MFGTSGVRGDLDALPPERMQRIGAAFASCFDAVVVGRDGRLTAGAMEDAFVSGVESQGSEVYVLGEAPTNVVAWTSREHEAGGAMLTASHNPPEDAGVKLFEADGAEAGEEVEDRVEAAMDASAVEWSDWTEKKEADAAEGYVEAAAEYVAARFSPDVDVSVAVDCGCGVAADATVSVLERLGADVTSVNAQSDGRFPARPSKPTTETLTGFVDLVLRRGFDLGVAHDGDGDRVVVVDQQGVVSEDGVVAALARHLLETSAEDLVLTTPNTSSRVDEAVEAGGGHVERVPLGGLPTAVRERDAVFAAEPWKPMFPDFGPWIDGSVAAAAVAALVDETPGVFDGLRDIEIRKTSVYCPEDLKEDVSADLETKLPEVYAGDVDVSYGVRVDVDDGWFLVRPSGTEPLFRVYSEGRPKLLDEVEDVVEDVVDHWLDEAAEDSDGSDTIR